MQGNRIRLLASGLLMLTASGFAQADALQPDPAWQEGKLPNGLKWQILQTPQRPSDRIEIRLSINTGSLAETAQQSGFTAFIPRIALTQSGSLPALQARSLWQQSIDPNRPAPPALVSYNFTMYDMSLPNNRDDLLKEALSWLAGASGKLAITQESIDKALSTENMVKTWPANPQDAWWRYRLQGSAMLSHAPGTSLEQPVDMAALKSFYSKWYTPDAMTLIIVGNIDSRSVSEQIAKIFGSLTGKRTTPATLPTLQPLKSDAVSLISNHLQQDRLSVMWDTPWEPIRDSVALLHYWRADLAREALFWHVQQAMEKRKVKDIGLGFDCRVLYQRAQCGLNLDTSGDTLEKNMALLSEELANVREKGLPQESVDALIEQKRKELQTLFATYARTDTGVLMNQRLRSLQNQVVDIAPEQYQKLRAAFLGSVTIAEINQELRQMLSQDMALVLLQPQGEAEVNPKKLREIWGKHMPVDVPTSSVTPDAPETPAAPDAGSNTSGK